MARCCRGSQLLLLAGCGAQNAKVDTPEHADSVPSTRLTIVVKDGSGAVTWTLTCDPPGGSHPNPTGACTALARATRPFDPVPADVNCTDVWGGPETATIRGVWRGEPVDASYKKTNGCEIARWNQIAAALGGGARPAPDLT